MYIFTFNGVIDNKDVNHVLRTRTISKCGLGLMRAFHRLFALKVISYFPQRVMDVERALNNDIRFSRRMLVEYNDRTGNAWPTLYARSGSRCHVLKGLPKAIALATDENLYDMDICHKHFIREFFESESLDLSKKSKYALRHLSQMAFHGYMVTVLAFGDNIANAECINDCCPVCIRGFMARVPEFLGARLRVGPTWEK